MNNPTEDNVSEFKEIPYYKVLKDALTQLPKGAFLTVKQKEHINTMTIGWGTFGVMWGKPVLVIGVRPSRFSFQFLDLGLPFTVSIPLTQKLKKELGYVGSHSGKNLDKIKESELHLQNGLYVDVPTIKECQLHFECVIVAKNQLIPEYIDTTIRERHYPEGDFHMIFYGEIIGSYKIVEVEE